jgi:hypothetical protein
VRAIGPTDTGEVATHHGDPRALLALAHAVCGRCPSAWLIMVPAVNLELGDPLSAAARRVIAAALAPIARLLPRCPSMPWRGVVARSPVIPRAGAAAVSATAGKGGSYQGDDGRWFTYARHSFATNSSAGDSLSQTVAGNRYPDSSAPCQATGLPAH